MDKNRRIVDGAHRFSAALVLKLEEVSCVGAGEVISGVVSFSWIRKYFDSYEITKIKETIEWIKNEYNIS